MLSFTVRGTPILPSWVTSHQISNARLHKWRSSNKAASAVEVPEPDEGQPYVPKKTCARLTRPEVCDFCIANNVKTRTDLLSLALEQKKKRVNLILWILFLTEPKRHSARLLTLRGTTCCTFTHDSGIWGSQTTMHTRLWWWTVVQIGNWIVEKQFNWTVPICSSHAGPAVERPR